MEHIKRIATKSYVCWLLTVLSAVFLWQMGGVAHALPALQLGPGSLSDWNYSGGTPDTWVTSSNAFSLDAFANATRDEGGDGNYAWDNNGSTDQYAYLVVSSLPKTGNVDGFDVSISNDGGALSLLTSGYGTPPVEDPNSLGSHGIFDTYFEIYAFQFDGALEGIGNTQPGDNGSGRGYKETFDITINSLFAGVDGVHFDLFTVSGDGMYNPPINADRNLVKAFAPYSHDAESVPGDSVQPVPEPSTGFLLGIGILGILGLGRKIKK